MVVAAITILWANAAFAQSSTYPDGARNAVHWYYCYASRTNTTASPPSGSWTATTCLKLLWSPGESYHMVASATTGGGTRYAEVVGWLMPARYVRTIQYRCLTAETGTRLSGTGSAGSTVSAENSVNFTPGTSDWSNGVTVGVGNAVGEAATNSLDVVAHWDAMAADNWWSHDVVANWTSSGNADGTGWRIINNQSTANYTTAGEFECWVLDWTMDDGHTPWVPGVDDMPPATATPVPTATGTPIVTPGFSFDDVTPWSPATPDPIDFGVTPDETECINFLPNFSAGESWFGGTVTTTLPSNYSICFEQYAFNLEFMGWDFGLLAVSAGLVAGFGALYGVIKRGG
jgi:hypothetical protein